VFKKFEKEVPQAIKTKIRAVTDTFYKQDRVENKDDENKEDEKKDESTVEDKLIQSFMNNSESDDIEVVKQMWAFNMPCIVLINGKREYWTSKISALFMTLMKDEMVSVRISLSAGLLEVTKLLNLGADLPDSKQLQQQMLEIANHFMNDEQSKVRLAFLPKLCDFVALFN
jgi:hypothetical protein